jgi:hypothetical protein
MRSKETIRHFQDYLRDLWSKASQMHSNDVSADLASQQIDMTNHSQNFAQIRGAGVDPRAIRRIYHLLDE